MACPKKECGEGRKADGRPIDDVTSVPQLKLREEATYVFWAAHVLIEQGNKREKVMLEERGKASEGRSVSPREGLEYEPFLLRVIRHD